MSLLLAAAAYWMFAEGRDAMDDSYIASARITYPQGTLFFQCTEGKVKGGAKRYLTVGLIVPQYVGHDEFRRMEYRFDQNPAKASAWTYSGSTVYNDDQRETPALAEAIKMSRSVVIRLYQSSGEQLTYRFDLPTDQHVIDRIVTRCQ